MGKGHGIDLTCTEVINVTSQREVQLAGGTDSVDKHEQQTRKPSERRTQVFQEQQQHDNERIEWVCTRTVLILNANSTDDDNDDGCELYSEHVNKDK